MECFYINLASATERRERIERSFASNRKPGWSLTRVDAITTDNVEKHQVPGRIRAAEKACLLSHTLALGLNKGSGQPFLVLEDDAEFGPETCFAIEAAAEKAKHLGNWDLIFTDVITPMPQDMMRLAIERMRYKSNSAPSLLSLRGMCFAGTTAYLVNPNSVDRLYNSLKELSSMELPYDLLLRNWVSSGQVFAYAAFPFLTTVRVGPQDSSVQLKGDYKANLAWDSFRRSMWIHASSEDTHANLSHLANQIESPSALSIALSLAIALEVTTAATAPA